MNFKANILFVQQNYYSKGLVLLVCLLINNAMAQEVPLRILDAHKYTVYTVDVSPDSKTILSGSWDNTIKLWDMDTGELLKSYYGHHQPVFSVRFSSDGKKFISCSKDFTVKIWDIESAAIEKNLVGHSSWVYTACFSPDGKLAASGGADTKIILWDTQSGEKVSTLTNHQKDVRKIVFSKDATLMASAADDNSIVIWDMKTLKPLHTLIGHTNEVWSVDFSPNNRYIISGSRDNTIRKWNVSTGEEIFSREEPTGWVNSVQFSPDGNVILSASHEQFSLWNATNGEYMKAYRQNAGAIYEARFSPDSKFVVATFKQAAAVWDVRETIMAISVASINWEGEHNSTLLSNSKFYPFEAHIAADSVLKSVQIFANDSLVYSKQNIKYKTSSDSIANMNAKIPLRNGNNVVEVVITNDLGEASTKRNIVYPLFTPEKSKERKLAVIIENYYYDTAFEIKPKKDIVTRLRKKILDAGYHVYHYTNRTMDDLYQIAEELNHQKQFDKYVIYYAGLALNQNQANFIVPVDARLDKIESKYLIDFQQIYNNAPDDKQKLLIIENLNYRSFIPPGYQFIKPNTTLIIQNNKNPDTFSVFTELFTKNIRKKRNLYETLFEVRKDLNKEIIGVPIEISNQTEHFFID